MKEQGHLYSSFDIEDKGPKKMSLRADLGNELDNLCGPLSGEKLPRPIHCDLDYQAGHRETSSFTHEALGFSLELHDDHSIAVFPHSKRAHKPESFPVQTPRHFRSVHA
jgi:hypothetical protein